MDISRGLRALADLLDASGEKSRHDYYRHLIPVGDRDALMRVVRNIGGHWEKDGSDDYFGLTRDLGDGVSIHVYAGRAAVCERHVIGTRRVKRPAPDAPTVEVEEEIVEWVCPPSILEAAR